MIQIIDEKRESADTRPASLGATGIADQGRHVPTLRFAKEEANALVSALKALAHPVRLQIVDLLSRHGGDVCVCDIEAQFEQKQPTISHHLRILREAGLIDCERRGLWAYYYTRPEKLVAVRELVSNWSFQ